MVIILTPAYDTKEDGLRIRREAKSRCFPGYPFCEHVDFFQNPLRKREFCEDRNAKCTGATCEDCECNDGYENFVSYTYGCLEYKKAIFFLSRGTLFEYERFFFLYI